jgi:phenylpropionate dioxygenase-like ring-hydroxylating dioxygenase large terminal subunit
VGEGAAPPVAPGAAAPVAPGRPGADDAGVTALPPPRPGAAAPEEPAPGPPSVVHLRDQWYIACASADLRGKPVPFKLMGTPLVAFRDAEGKASVLLDRCPHRMVPLSLGGVVEGQIECSYHGWRFDGDGVCRKVPGLCSAEEGRSRDVPRYPTAEQDGYVWVYATPGADPERRPYKLPVLDAPGYVHVRRSVVFEGTLHAAMENALDVPHTAFLHRGLFRGGREPVEIQAVMTRDERSVQTEFIGEPKPPGLAAKILSPGSDGVVTHFDRFLLPSIAQVEYRLGDENHICTTSMATPVDDFETKMFAVVSLKLRLPVGLLKPIIEPFAMQIFRQDAWILKEQTEAIARWGGERFQSTEIDLMGAQIWRLLKRAEKGKLGPDDPPWRKDVRLKV